MFRISNMFLKQDSELQRTFISLDFFSKTVFWKCKKFSNDSLLYSQPKVRFRECFEYFLMRRKSFKIYDSEGAENIEFTY